MSLELDDLNDSESSQSPSDSESVEDTITQPITDDIKTRQFKKPKSIHRWRAEHFKTFPWIQYDADSKEASCKYPKCHMYVFNLSPLMYSKWQYPKLQSWLFLQHEKTTRHTRQSRQVVPKGQKPFQLPVAPDLADDAIWTRIHCAWWLAKEDVAISKFPSYLEATLIDKGLQPPTTYKDEKFAWELVELIGKRFQKELQHRIRKSPYFDVMADEITDNSADQ